MTMVGSDPLTPTPCPDLQPAPLPTPAPSSLPAPCPDLDLSLPLSPAPPSQRRGRGQRQVQVRFTVEEPVVVTVIAEPRHSNSSRPVARGRCHGGSLHRGAGPAETSANGEPPCEERGVGLPQGAELNTTLALRAELEEAAGAEFNSQKAVQQRLQRSTRTKNDVNIRPTGGVNVPPLRQLYRALVSVSVEEDELISQAVRDRLLLAPPTRCHGNKGAELNTTLALRAELEEVAGAEFNSQKAVQQRLQRSTRTKNDVNIRPTGGVNVPPLQQLYRALVSVSVEEDELLSQAVRDRLLLAPPTRCHGNKEEAPDVRVFFSDDLLREKPLLPGEELPMPCPQPSPRPAHSTFDLYNRHRQWEAGP